MIAAIALGAAAPAAHAAGGGLQARVMVLPPEGTTPSDPRLADDVGNALMRGARKATPNVARATATLADTAVIVGCDPADRACADAVAAALNVDQMLLVRLSEQDGEASVEITAMSREAEPVSRTFPVRAATRKQDLAEIEAAVPVLLDAENKGSDGGGEPPDGPPDQPPDPPEGDGTGGGAIGGGTGNRLGSGDPNRRPASAPRAPMFVTIGGGAMFAGGLAFWGLAYAKQGEIDDAATATAADLQHLQDLEDSGRRSATIGNVLVIAGGITAGAGAFWWWRTHQRRDAVIVTPAVGPDQAGVIVGGRW